MEDGDDTAQGLRRGDVDVLRTDHEKSPAAPVQCLAALDVRTPLLVRLGVLAAVVLDREPYRGVAEVEAHDDIPGVVADRVVDGWLGQPREHDEHA